MSEIDIAIKFAAKIPTVPNFIMAADGSDRKIPIEDLTEDQLRAIGRRWTDNLVWAAKNRRDTKPTP